MASYSITSSPYSFWLLKPAKMASTFDKSRPVGFRFGLGGEWLCDDVAGGKEGEVGMVAGVDGVAGLGGDGAAELTILLVLLLLLQGRMSL